MAFIYLGHAVFVVIGPGLSSPPALHPDYSNWTVPLWPGLEAVRWPPRNGPAYRAGAGARPAFGGPPEELAGVIKDTRNYYVHYDPHRWGRALHGLELGSRRPRLCAVRSVLWSNLGMPDPMITKILETDWRYQAAARSRLPTP